MPERFSELEKASVAKQNEEPRRGEEIRSAERDLLRRLRENPQLQAKIEAMLAIIENAGGDVEKAEAERRTIEELRQMGNEALRSWARPSAAKEGSGMRSAARGESQRKKSSTGSRDWERSK
jgi:hypothetical protein